MIQATLYPGVELDHRGQPIVSRCLRVLLVVGGDDEVSIIAELRRGGYDVVHERIDSDIAMRAAFQRTTWDVVVSALALPRFGGLAALAVLNHSGLDVPLIIVSDTIGVDDAVAAMRAGAKDYVVTTNLARLCPAIAGELHDAAARAEQRKKRERLLISERMTSVGTLAAGVAHEINNPLAAIIANLELTAAAIAGLATELALTDRLQAVFEQLRDARDSAERLRHIVRDLRIFSSSPDAERVPVAVKDVLESSFRMAWNEVRHRAQLITEYGNVPPVDANAARLGQVFLNLIVNAAQGIPEGDVEHHSIRVTTGVDASGRVRVELRDSGAGIARENLSRIFDAFFTTKPTGAATGLGLTICHKIVTDLGGTIEVESELGKGTTFRVLLPASTSDPSVAHHQPRAAAATRRGRVLVIDDEPTIARAIWRSLEREHDVTVSASAGEALERIVGGERFDVILSDLMMPHMTGMELHDELVRSVPEQAARMVFLTGGAFTSGARDFLDAVRNHRVEKPFDTQQLRALINDQIKATS